MLELIKLIMGGENFKVDKLLKLKIKCTIFISIFFVIFYKGAEFYTYTVDNLEKNENSLKLLMKRAIFLTVVSTFIFVIFPMKFYFPKPEIANPIFKILFHILGLLDSNFNQCPSLHVSFAFLSVAVYCREIKSKFLKVFLCLWGFLLAISILFVYQHHFIDFVGGTLIFFITCIIFPRKK